MHIRYLLAIFFTIALFFLHYDWWNWQPNPYLVIDIIPFDLVYHVLWVALSVWGLGFILRTFWGSTE